MIARKIEGKGLPLPWHLAALGAGVAAPLLLLVGVLLWQGATAERARLEQAARAEAHDIAVLLDREIAGMVATLHALATSPPLARGDLEQFDRHARQLVALQGVNVVLRLPDGQQVVNTRLPWGSPLPLVPLLPSDRVALATGTPQVSNLVEGAVARAPVFMVEVPVSRDGIVAYLLNLSLPAEHIARLLDARNLPHGWWATVIDGDGTIVARTINPASVGTKVLPPARQAMSRPVNSVYMRSPEGVENFATFRRAELSGWTAAIAVPGDVLLAPLYRSLAWLGLLTGAAVVLAAGLGLFYGRRIAGAVTGLARAAVALGRGEPPPPVPAGVREAVLAADALADARRELEASSRERDELLQTLGRSPAMVRGLDGTIQFWGQGAERLYGWTADEAVGRVAHELLASRLPEPLEAITERLLRRGGWEGEVRQRHKAGHAVVVSSNWALRRDPHSGEPLSVVETNIDLTAQKQTESALTEAKAEAERANAAKSRFLAAASHDLRQPLQALHLYVDVLAGRLTASQRPLMEPIRLCLSSLTELLNGMLDLAKLESGIVTPARRDFALGELLAKLVSGQRPNAAAKGLALRLVPCTAVAHTDPVLFERIILNLVSNAIRYTESGGVVVGCRRHGGRLWVEVWDSGIGIPEDRLSEVFEEYVQLGNPERSRDKGCGLGLSIVRRAAELLGLGIRVGSRLGRGSMFAVEVPAACHVVSTSSR